MLPLAWRDGALLFCLEACWVTQEKLFRSLWARLWSPGSCCFAGGVAGRQGKEQDRAGGDNGTGRGASQVVGGPVPGSCAGSLFARAGDFRAPGEPGEAPARLPAGSCPQPGHSGLSPAAAPEVAAPEVAAPETGAWGLPQRMLAPLVGLCGTGRVCTRSVWRQGDAAERPGLLCSSPSPRAGP